MCYYELIAEFKKHCIEYYYLCNKKVYTHTPIGKEYLQKIMTRSCSICQGPIQEAEITQ